MNVNNTTKEIQQGQQGQQIIGVMTSRPAYLHITKKKKKIKYSIYYVDYLCVDFENRKKGIAPKIIQTHEYIQRHQNPSTYISLFKREGELTGIVPLCVYKSFCFSNFFLKKKEKEINDLAKESIIAKPYNLVECTEKNFDIFIHFIKDFPNKFDVFIISDFSNILELIKTQNLFIYLLIDKQQIVQCAYFYKKSCMYFFEGPEGQKEALTCVASICTSDKNNDLFIKGFYSSFFQKSKSFGYLGIENISDNYILLEHHKKNNSIMFESPTAYFFYNYIYPSCSSKKVFVLL
jgi:hypothetical protein